MGMVAVYAGLNRPQRPVVSVCIANYNGEGLMVPCLDSLRQQASDFDFEVIVHDDTSTDGSVGLIRERYPEVELLVSDQNVGFCVGNNRMVAHARGEFILLLNNDAALYPDALACLLAAARGQLRPAILTLPQYNWESGELVDRGCRLDPFYNPVPNLDYAKPDVAFVPGACLWIPRSEWDSIGGFPEWFESVAEDLYLCCAGRLAGLDVRVVDGSGYRHRQGHSFGGNRPHSGRLVTTFRRRRLSERNKTFALVVMTPTLLVWPLLAAHLAILMIEGLVLSLLKMDPLVLTRIYAQVGVELWVHRRQLLEDRRRRQTARAASQREYWRPFSPIPHKLAMLVRYGVPGIRG